MSIMAKTSVFLRNSIHVHERIMAAYLRRAGWVVFYLDPQSRECRQDTCWMRLYQSEINK